MIALTLGLVLALGSAPMLDVVGELIAQIGRKGDAASATGTLHAKVRDIKDNLGTYTGYTSLVSVQYPLFSAAPIAVNASAIDTLTAWVELVAASTLSDHVLTHFVVYPIWGGATASTWSWSIEIGEGGAGSEGVIGRISIGGHSANGTVERAGYSIPIVPARRVTANARVAVRAATSNLDTSSGLRIRGIFLPRI